MTGLFAVSRLAPDAAIPGWCCCDEPFVSVTRTDRELSIVASEGTVPADAVAERGFAALRVVGSLDFGLVGLLARLAGALAEAGVPLLVISTYDTDVLLVRETHLDTATRALAAAGVEMSG